MCGASSTDACCFIREAVAMSECISRLCARPSRSCVAQAIPGNVRRIEGTGARNLQARMPEALVQPIRTFPASWPRKSSDAQSSARTLARSSRDDASRVRFKFSATRVNAQSISRFGLGFTSQEQRFYRPGGDIFLDLHSEDGKSVRLDWSLVNSQMARAKK